jgi:DHA3 family macrolide efflux protein-like MFS transporter
MKLWNKNFALLWQGQMVSSVGDTFFQLALGFWVLQKTGSTAVMGIILAAGLIPVLILGPFSGVLVDRMNRKRVIVLGDVIRGITVLVIAIAALTGTLEVWMLPIAAVLIGITASFFDPAITSSLPDLIPKEKLLQGNSIFSSIPSVADILGSSIGGVVFAFIGAPLLFLFNSISFLFSALSETFIDVPKVRHEKEEFHFLDDFKDGFKFFWGTRALRKLAINVSMTNFLLSIAAVLFLAYFERNIKYSSVEYGFAMASLTIGSVLGFIGLSAIPIKPQKKFIIFTVSVLIFSTARTLVFMYDQLYIIYLFLFFIGITVAVVNSFIQTTLQVIVPQDKRGKVFAFLGTFAGGMVPLSMLTGGILAEFFPIKWIIFFSGILVFFSFFPVLIDKDIKEFINFEVPAES